MIKIRTAACIKWSNCSLFKSSQVHFSILYSYSTAKTVQYSVDFRIQVSCALCTQTSTRSCDMRHDSRHAHDLKTNLVEEAILSDGFHMISIHLRSHQALYDIGNRSTGSSRPCCTRCSSTLHTPGCHRSTILRFPTLDSTRVQQYILYWQYS